MNDAEIQVGLQQAQEEFLRAGGKLHLKTTQEKLEAARQRGIHLHKETLEMAEEEQAKNRQKQPSWARAAADIAWRGLAAVSITFALFVTIVGLTLGTVLLVIAEVMAVNDGWMVIDPQRALLYSIATVSFYIVMLFVRAVLASQYEQDYKVRFSLRLVWYRLLYFLGFGDEWRKQYADVPGVLTKVDAAVRWLMWSIVVFGLLGRLGDKMAMDTSVWYVGIQNIFTQSTMIDFAGYVGATLATAALLIATHFVVDFIYANFRNVTGGIQVRDFSAASITVYSVDQAIEAEQVRMLQAETMRLQLKNQEQ